MGSTIEKIEKNVATVKLEVTAEEFNKAINKSYQKNKGRFNIPGFRKGKAPRVIIEKHYGEGVFYEDAIDFAFPEAYAKAVKELDLKPVARPTMESIDEIGAKEGLKMTISLAIKPEVELGEYKGTEIESLDGKVTDEDLENELKRIQNENARLVSVDENTAAKEFDIVIIDYEGFKDGVAFEGGKGSNYSLELGSKTFIPGFEEQLIGVKTGEEREIKVTFPEEYHAEDLAGQEATFKVKVHEIKTKELPELDDEFVKDISEFDTLEEYKNDLKEKLQERKTKELRDAAENKVISTATDNAKVDVPEPLIEEEIDKAMQNFQFRMQSQGLTMEQYYMFTNTTEESLRESIREDITRQLKTEFVLEKISEVENIEVTDEEVNAELENYAKQFGMEVDKLKETLPENYKESFKDMAKRKKTIEFLIDNAVQK